jgi:uncharacterized protein YkwD
MLASSLLDGGPEGRMRLAMHLALVTCTSALVGCSVDDDWVNEGEEPELGESESAVTGSFADAAADDHAARFNPHRRSHRDRRALDQRQCLDEIARRRARKMADGLCPGGDAICHFGGLGNAITGACPFGWSSAGENVGIGSTELGLWQAFLGSPSHHANIDSADFDRFGVGAFRRDRDNALFIVHVFANGN